MTKKGETCAAVDQWWAERNKIPKNDAEDDAIMMADAKLLETLFGIKIGVAPCPTTS